MQTGRQTGSRRDADGRKVGLTHVLVRAKRGLIPADLLVQIGFQIGKVVRDHAALRMIFAPGDGPALFQQILATAPVAAHRDLNGSEDSFPASHAATLAERPDTIGQGGPRSPAGVSGWPGSLVIAGDCQ
jgi:hypothetical protein